MDVATYNHCEVEARAELGSWKTQQMFAPYAFEMTGFPTRLAHFGEVRGLLVGVHHNRRVPDLLRDLDGLREDDFKWIGRGLARYLGWFQSCFPDDVVPIPLADILAGYLVYTKLSGLDRRSRILEVGPGYGFVGLFLHDDSAVRSYDMLEVTQSLFVIQSSLSSYCYGAGFRNRALSMISVSEKERVGGWFGSERPYFTRLLREYRCSLYPWWKANEAMAAEYDVITSNGNLAEFSPQALNYYLANWKSALSSEGYLIVQDVGDPVHTKVDQVVNALNEHGYRALVKCAGQHDSKYFFMGNLLLVTERHPDFGIARSVLEPTVFIAENPVVRRVYGLDRPSGRMVTPAEIFDQVRRAN